MTKNPFCVIVLLICFFSSKIVTASQILIRPTGEEVDLSQLCQSKKQCLAQVALDAKNPKRPKSPFYKNAAHPASLFCREMGGFDFIYKSKDAKSYDVCEFKDGSKIKSWTLYFKHFPIAKINPPSKIK